MALRRGQPVGATSENNGFLNREYVLSGDSEAESLIEGLRIRKEPELSNWREVLEQAGCDVLYRIGDEISVLPSDFGSSVINTVAEFLNSSDWNVRDSAARVLGHSGDQRVIPLLRQLLADPEEGLVRFAAVKALSKLGYIFSQSERRRLLSDESGMVKAEAAQMYVQEGELGPVRQLLTSQNAGDRLIAAEALIRGGFRDAAGEIVDILKHRDLGHRIDVVRLLQMSGDPRYIPLLASADDDPVDDPKDVLRSAVARAIQSLQRS